MMNLYVVDAVRISMGYKEEIRKYYKEIVQRERFYFRIVKKDQQYPSESEYLTQLGVDPSQSILVTTEI